MPQYVIAGSTRRGASGTEYLACLTDDNAGRTCSPTMRSCGSGHTRSWCSEAELRALGLRVPAAAGATTVPGSSEVMVFTEEEVGIPPTQTWGQRVMSFFGAQPVPQVYAPSTEGKGFVQQPVEYGEGLLAYGADVMDPAAQLLSDAVASGVTAVAPVSRPVWPWVVGGAAILGVLVLGGLALTRRG